MARGNPSSSHDGYNGWKNYESWAVALWIDNDEGSLDYWRDVIKDTIRQRGGISKVTDAQYKKDYGQYKVKTGATFDAVCLDVADSLKDWHEGMTEELGMQDKGIFTDLLEASLGEVDWEAVAQHLVVGTIESWKQ